MNVRGDQYHQSLFSRDEEQPADIQTTDVIPQASIYDTPPQFQLESKEKYMTVFGFSQQNRASVMEQIRKTVTVEKREEGKNYVNIWTEDPSELDLLLKLNYKTINGEIIGVFRRNFGVIEDEEIYVKKKGIFKILSEYLFGE